MKSLSSSLLFLLLTSTASRAQENIDPVQEAIRKFESSRNKKPAEVIVTLDPPPAVPTVAEPEPTLEPNETPAAPDPQVPPVATPPPAPPTTPASEPKPAPGPKPQPTTQEEPAKPPTPPPGVSVSVRTLESGGQPLDTSSLKIHAPFPAKPLTQAPKGWLIEPSDNIPPYTQQVELEPGKTITLSVKPHVMVPDADGIQTFMVPEPGYNPALEYKQNATIGAVLAGSLRQLDADSKQLGATLDQLEQLLISLPKPKARPVPEP